MKNNKGFTLVELIAVIVILLVIASIVVTSAFSLVKANQEDQYKVLIQEIEQATKLYLSDNYENYVVGRQADNFAIKLLTNGSCDKAYIKLSNMVNSSYLKEDSLIDPRTNKKIDLEKYIEVKYEDNALTISDEFVTSPNYSCTGITYDDSTKTYTITSQNNYLTFNNQLFRILKINKDGSIRLMLDSDIGSSIFGSSNAYETSYVLSSIQYWYIYDISKYAKELIREASIQLITQVEYNSLTQNMKTDEEIWLLTTDKTGITNKTSTVDYPSKSAKIKPVLELKPNAIYVSGDGSLNNPYIIR